MKEETIVKLYVWGGLVGAFIIVLLLRMAWYYWTQ